MENKFGIKELFFTCLLIILIVSVWLGMKQFDRQYELIRTLKDTSDDQTRTLAEISRQLAVGIRTVGGATSEAEPAGSDPFARMKTAEAQKGYAQGDWLIQAFPVNLEKISAPVATDTYAIDGVWAHVLEGLITRDPVTLEWQPLIATSWKISPDGLTITLPMRHGVTFSDGKPCTADDVIYSFNLIMNPKVEAPALRSYYENISSVSKTDDYTVVFKFKEPYFDELSLVAGLNILPKHFYSQFTVDQLNLKPGLLMGTGPYRLQDPANWGPGQQLVLLRNERYWGPPPGFDRLVFREISNEVANLTAFTNGETDIFSAVPEQYERLLKMPDVVKRTQHYEYSTPINGFNFIAWNEQRNGKATLFADKRVRQAMTLLMDRDRILKEIFLGYASKADGPFYPQSKQHMPGMTPWPYDPARAKSLLAQLGYKLTNGQLIGPNGQPFRFKMTYGTGSPTVERMVLFIRDELAGAGITLEPDPLDWSVFDERIKNRDFDAISLGWTGVIEDDPYQIFDSSQIKDQGDDFVSYKNAELDQLIEKARRTVDQAKRMPMWQRVDQILHDDEPYTFLFNRKSLVFLDARIRNVQITPLGLNDRVEWWVPKELRKWEK
ncbi:MAG TPA: ABC transporter substrate-binding protein [Tepidisphaeraceae bacterium]|jgi:peptide/nickel transport system substrate-binding protein